MKRWLAPADAVLQQLAWWAAVLLAAGGREGMAALPGAAVAAAHLLARPAERRGVALTAVAAAAFGFATDTLLVRAGLVSFGGGGPVSPAFMVGLWAAFGAGLTASLRWLAAWPSWRVAAVAALAGPFAYRAGAALGAMELGQDRWLALAAVAAQWAVGLPALALVARRLDGAGGTGRSHRPAGATPGQGRSLRMADGRPAVTALARAGSGPAAPAGRRWRWAR